VDATTRKRNIAKKCPSKQTLKSARNKQKQENRASATFPFETKSPSKPAPTPISSPNSSANSELSRPSGPTISSVKVSLGSSFIPMF
jgi:hypothetical protein